jgi:hypothetical protein
MREEGEPISPAACVQLRKRAKKLLDTRHLQISHEIRERTEDE